MNEVYRRKPAPRDWPMPADIVTRQIDVTTNMLASAFCPSAVVGTEFFIAGTDPISQCTAHTGAALYPDTSGLGGSPPYPPGTVPPPGAPPVDTSRRYRDSSIFFIPRRDTTRRIDTTRIRPPDTSRVVRPPIRPDTTGTN